VTDIETSILERLAQKISPESRLRRAWSLKGGLSAQMTAFEIEQPGGRTRKLIARQPGEHALQRNPAAAADEFRLLGLLRASGLPVPTPRLLDESGEILPAPYLVIDYIEGEPLLVASDLDGGVVSLADQLARIHSLPAFRADLSFLPLQVERLARSFAARPSGVDDTLDEGRIRQALEAVWPLPPVGEPVLMHGDFWPGNILCREGLIAAVIDWEEAKLGEPLADVAMTRLDLLWAFGIEAMHAFTARYQSVTGVDLGSLPYWDLLAALRPISNIAEWADAWNALGRPDITEASMRDGHRRFVSQAFAKLGDR